ncbi:family 16 glycosylhydrolase [Clostridium oryzae]|uniref:Glucan endo-1,3-beta-glucosidase A1 n=1 Tax=Clostridium oryzae TaxID=1450648 RepID=A0A1V4I876_9CLOT|nr:family 16 glycosylhydrolase [Clostridium oryzae]OPJ56109.1 glucan endo-1,3-beta-glucosidase A1 precursor [Clostridium oryzae]
MKAKKYIFITAFIFVIVLIVGIFKFYPIIEKDTGRNNSGQVNKNNEWKLIWNDEFDEDKLDLKKWDYDIGNGSNGWGNNELEYYTKRNVSVADGVLTIAAKNEQAGTQTYTSGRIRTKNVKGDVLFSTTYGKIEARIKMPAGSGLWPAFWMLPVENTYGTWPLSGEIDIMEARGRLLEQIQGAIHYGNINTNNTQSFKVYNFPSGRDITDYHTYSIEWNSNRIDWYVDGRKYYSENKWYTKSEDKAIDSSYPAPFNRPFYLLLNLAVGGNFDNGAAPDNAKLPAKMQVDYVRVYQKLNLNSEKVNNSNETEKKSSASSQKGTSILKNGFFDEGKNGWKAYNTEVSELKSDGKNGCKLKAKPSNQSWNSMFIRNSLDLKPDVNYELSFRAKSSQDGQLFAISLEDSQYKSKLNQQFLTGLNWKKYNFRFKVDKESELALKFILGAVEKECSLYLRNVSIKQLKEE